MKNYLEILSRSMKNVTHDDMRSKKFSEIYDDLFECLSLSEITKMNNLFVLLTGISLETLFDSESVEELVENGYIELLSDH